jgi:hypothetical protein
MDFRIAIPRRFVQHDRNTTDNGNRSLGINDPHPLFIHLARLALGRSLMQIEP